MHWTPVTLRQSTAHLWLWRWYRLLRYSHSYKEDLLWTENSPYMKLHDKLPLIYPLSGTSTVRHFGDQFSTGIALVLGVLSWVVTCICLEVPQYVHIHGRQKVNHVDSLQYISISMSTILLISFALPDLRKISRFAVTEWFRTSNLISVLNQTSLGDWSYTIWCIWISTHSDIAMPYSWLRILDRRSVLRDQTHWRPSRDRSKGLNNSREMYIRPNHLHESPPHTPIH